MAVFSLSEVEGQRSIEQGKCDNLADAVKLAQLARRTIFDVSECH